MRVSTVITGCVVLGAMAAVVFSFANGASPYITFAEARERSGDRLHLGCDIVPGSVKTNIADRTVQLKVKDSTGEIGTVVHRGDPVDFKQATKIVAIGKIDGDVFVSQQILVKCPSKYEGQDGKSKGYETPK